MKYQHVLTQRVVKYVDQRNMFSFMVLIVFLSGVDKIKSGPCEDAEIFHGSEFRGVTCPYETGFDPLSDLNYINETTWYRFPENSMTLATSPVPLHFCSTYYPIWMNGTLPNIGEGSVERKACGVTGYSNCDEVLDIKVQKCSNADTGNYFVYQLAAPYYLYSAYCVENGNSCDSKDPCHPFFHKYLPRFYKERSSSCLNQRENPISDYNLLTGWYILNGESDPGVIPEHCPPQNYCGTVNTVWLNGTHPGLEVTVNGTMCVHTSEDQCCGQQIPTKIKNCKAGYYVYHLESTKATNQAYCIDTKFSCATTTQAAATTTTQAAAAATTTTETATTSTTERTVHNDMTNTKETNINACKDAEILLGYEFRGVKCRYESGFEPLSDLNYINETTWYRFPENSMTLATSPVPLHFCSTYYPIWMNGTLPTSTEEAATLRKVCLKTGYSDCHDTFDIKIKKCSDQLVGDFYVYQLAAPSMLYSAYCVGNSNMCSNKDPCHAIFHQPLPRFYKERSSTCPKNIDKYISDYNLITRWYILNNEMDPGIIPTKCPPRNYCGTENPVWYNGTNPQSGQTMNGTMCVRTSDNQCCGQKIPTKNKKCAAGYNVYYLESTKEANQAYCVDTNFKCLSETTPLPLVTTSKEPTSIKPKLDVNNFDTTLGHTGRLNLVPVIVLAVLITVLIGSFLLLLFARKCFPKKRWLSRVSLQSTDSKVVLFYSKKT